MPDERPYVFPVVTVERVVDGDTYWLRVDVGFRQVMLVHVRLDGWDTPELRAREEYEREAARKARDFVTLEFARALTEGAGGLWIETGKDPDNFGRWLGVIWRGSDGAELGALLALEGLATPWPQRWREANPGA